MRHGALRQLAAFSLALAGALAAVVVLSAGAHGQSTPQREVSRSPQGLPYVSGELVVSYSTPLPRRPSVVAGERAEVERNITGLRIRVLSFPQIRNERAMETVRRALENNPSVSSADYNYLRRPGFTPDDPRFGGQYGLKKPGFPRAWNATRGGGARIAVIDTGIAQNHPDLKGKVALQRDFVNGDSTAEDNDGHGTHVAGIAAAQTDNGKGVAGACPGCRLLIGKAIGPDVAGVDDEIAAIKWAADRGADVINLSLGGRGYVESEERAVNYAWNHGSVVVAAAGNNASSIKEYPAAYPNAIAVSATNSNDRRASFSNRGDWVDVAAPGVGIVSTFPGGYEKLSGTSMSTPHVSGLAGLLASQGRGKQAIRNRLQNTAKDLGPDGKDPYYGHGRIDAYRAAHVNHRQVVDNNWKRFSASGAWRYSRHSPQKYGKNYRWAWAGRPVKQAATYSMRVPLTSRYQVYVRWPAKARHNPATHVRIRTAGGWAHRAVNQRHNGGKWVRIATVKMAEGNGRRVQIYGGRKGAGRIVADAVRIQAL